MIKNLDKVHWSSLTICSGGCNLNCSYCNIAQSKDTSSYTSYLKDSQDSLLNGKYLKNILTAFTKFNQSINNITNLEIWGNEPTLLLKNLNQVWPEWNKLMPKLETIVFSTNGIANMDDIFNFAQIIDKTTKIPVFLNIQISYDGKFAEKNVRKFKAEDNVVINNLLYLIKQLNSIKLTNLVINFNLHAVLSIELMKKCSSIDNLKQFIQEYSDITDIIRDTIINKNINFICSDLISVTDQPFTSEIGIEYAAFFRKLRNLVNNKRYSMYIDPKELNDEAIYVPQISKQLFGVIETEIITLCQEHNIHNFNDLINLYLQNKNYTTLVGPTMCGGLQDCLRITHNGDLLDCHASLYDPYIDETKIDNSVFQQARWQTTKHGRYPNINTSTDEELSTVLKFYLDARDPTVLYFMMQQFFNRIYLMAQCGQADESYLYDYKKLARHSFMLARAYQCFSSEKLLNGSIFIRNNGEIRLYCNGILDIIDEDIRKEIGEIQYDND